MSLIRTLLGSLLFLLSLIFVIWLVYSNSEPVTLKLVWLMGEGVPNPFARAGQVEQIMLPLGIWFIFFTVIGIIIGLFCGWFIGGGTRVRARQQGKRARDAEKELKSAKEQNDAAKTEMDTLKTEKKDLETKVKEAETTLIAAPTEVKQITS